MPASDTRENCEETREPSQNIDAVPCISALRASPDRFVFTEEGNCDGWIATDHTVTLKQ
ncbi:hypothetical protein HUB97_08215 [Halorubraceae archaeon YAN]|nr:hypothetical protein [Halorubraceae archaeon YAN]